LNTTFLLTVASSDHTNNSVVDQQMSEPVFTRTQYILFCALELTGMFLILWHGLPIYRRLFALEIRGTVADEVILWIGVIAIQVSYWPALRHNPPFNFPRQAFIGLVFVFISRLSFVFASSFFALVIYRHPEAFQFSPRRVLVFFAVLFSVFCFSRHVEAVGNHMIKGPQDASR
jgi:hypothetical protein